ncbi:hypothetical protein Y032_0125g1288 [Ancylostoma ceylanicum]|uniref:Uncharacterized protein n=1 Tax=Ancylostoma ceylanicum TaxID=53326 RepID=A0A016T8Y9_9BILA|nr:hypothetical protein Y032_0125g1288 [Ancylostoma ceylanicum]
MSTPEASSLTTGVARITEITQGERVKTTESYPTLTQASIGLPSAISMMHPGPGRVSPPKYGRFHLF